jgi:SAM-dependent methyltransferase
MREIIFRFAAALIFILAVNVQAAQSFSLVTQGSVPERLDVPYVPTPDEIVAEMIMMAGITDKDIVYDLGCGDGRIVIAACRKTGARGVGVDIDPDRIAECLVNAKEAKVGDRVKFIQQDLFKTDFSEATVLALYLLPELNLKLRPRILNELRPGSRVISHNYSMGDWLPDTVRDIDSGHTIYLWTVPANVGGTWDCLLKNEGARSYKKRTLKLDQGYQVVTGNISAPGGPAAISNARLKGADFLFTLNEKGPKGTESVVFKARVKGNTLEGTFESAGSKSVKGIWKARREPSTVKPLDGSGSRIMNLLQ